MRKKITHDTQTGNNYQIGFEISGIPVEVTKNKNGYYMRINNDDVRIEASQDDRWLFSRMLDRVWAILESQK